MSFPVILAHGSLGAFDEIIYLGVGVAFLAMMGISWLKARNMPPELDEPPTEETPTDESESPDRFRLD